MGKTTSYREQPYGINDWFITTTPTGRKTARWAHNKRAIETFCGHDAEKRAKIAIRCLIEELNREREEFLNPRHK